VCSGCDRRADKVGSRSLRLRAVLSPMEQDRQIGVAIVADVYLHAKGLKQILSETSAVNVVGTVRPNGDLISRLVQLCPDLVLIDAQPSQTVVAAAAIRRRLPGIRTIVLAPETPTAETLAYARAGVVGYIHPSASAVDLEEALIAVAGEGAWCSPQTAAFLLTTFATLDEVPGDRVLPRITPREYEVLTLINDGLSNRQIAAHLCIEETTVKNHVHNILEKLPAKSRQDAARIWRMFETREQAGAVSKEAQLALA
jgi:two-component system, NarL family, nitrate/nitrite response regulator NarL